MHINVLIQRIRVATRMSRFCQDDMSFQKLQHPRSLVLGHIRLNVCLHDTDAWYPNLWHHGTKAIWLRPAPLVLFGKRGTDLQVGLECLYNSIRKQGRSTQLRCPVAGDGVLGGPVDSSSALTFTVSDQPVPGACTSTSPLSVRRESASVGGTNTVRSSEGRFRRKDLPDCHSVGDLQGRSLCCMRAGHHGEIK